ncbi:Far7p Ecym_6125 [Eremothecium cymbalariae DBVPG|uniref:Uncharacterized protein n=1 Tax=Eremothecium cymbalariae (strain CBS 270.75 / DBVPG 7215 / KCTC 17166 / NRRL Y-17582) TaxID=931890 RepID=G8JV38_ERECY|nr:hypothetical protein Ecym_6125 [Eremothecium cymbalariae DBVPG\
MEQEPHVMFMNPQTENLKNLYDLVQNLSELLNKNKQERNKLLREIDVLANRMHQSVSPKDYAKDVRVFDIFLKRRGIECEGNGEEGINLEYVWEQNKRLRAVLDQKSMLNRETSRLLGYHENSLAQVVKLLRDDVFKYHIELIEKCRRVFNEKVCQIEDLEFKAYIENISDIQDLINMSKVYQSLLRLE